MPSLLKNLIIAGKISDRCLHCHLKLGDRDCQIASNILGTVQFQHIHDHRNYDYHVDLWTLSRCRFCHSCATDFPQKVKDYHLELTKCLADEIGSDSRHESGHKSSPRQESPPKLESKETRTESRRRKERRTCTPNELEELAKRIKQMESATNGFKKHAEMVFEGTTEIAKLKHENAELLAEGTRRIAELNQQNKDLIAEGTTRIGELNKQNADLIVEANAKFAELMQKITELESRNLCLQEQMQTQHTIDHTDITKMAGTIKELNAGLHQCYGERYKIWLTPTSRYVVNTLEPR